MVRHAVVAEGAEQAGLDAARDVAPEDEVVATEGEQVAAVGALGRGREAARGNLR